MFDAKKEVNLIISNIRKYFEDNNLGGIIIGISGGKDSAVVAALFCKAIGSENVIGVTMPCHSNSLDKSDAEIISDKYGFQMINIDLTDTFDTFKKQINYDDVHLENSDINLKPRLRMATLYYLAPLFSSVKGKTYIVAGTGNKCEIYVGYFTKGGDGTSDINVLANYSVSEVIKIGQYLSVPEEVLYKKPSDGLSNLSDEDKLGVTYEEIENYMSDSYVKDTSKQIIKKMHDTSAHKKGAITFERR